MRVQRDACYIASAVAHAWGKIKTAASPEVALLPQVALRSYFFVRKVFLSCALRQSPSPSDVRADVGKSISFKTLRAHGSYPRAVCSACYTVRSRETPSRDAA